MITQLASALRAITDPPPDAYPYLTPVEGMMILRASAPRPPSHLIHRPALCAVAQGAKWTAFGEGRYDYRAGQALVVNIEMPAVGRVYDASEAMPFLGLVMELDLSILGEVLQQLAIEPAAQDFRAIDVLDLNDELIHCLWRATQLLHEPTALQVLYPGIMREICYWLLTGPQGASIAHMALGHQHTHRVLSAIHALRARYAEPIRVEELAAIAQLSPSAFHRHFKRLTAMSPVQYQKQLRLLEARRLLVDKVSNIEKAASQVGYESPSQFSRDYTRFFGDAPRRDIQRFQHGMLASA
ncbi:AraC family transcriptional regulator N-terminal domain-containing protein [Pokkaliibacter sp. CJK22405]|uniref:AraC family transcriptional regulator n=1 Tax=Pokkaliibacter sp. CJK22405 TaxID=3384615 RepID=UPI003984BD49